MLTLHLTFAIGSKDLEAIVNHRPMLLKVRTETPTVKDAGRVRLKRDGRSDLPKEGRLLNDRDFAVGASHGIRL